VGINHLKSDNLKTYSLRTQIIASMAFLTIISVTIVGLTALGINYRYLENAKRQQSLSMISSFYQAQENKLTDLVVLISSHLASDAINGLENPSQLKIHLDEIHKGIPKIDTIIVCDYRGQIISFSGDILPTQNCNLEGNLIYTTALVNGERQAWLLRRDKILAGNPESPIIVLSIHLDDQLLMEMCSTCDLYHSIIYQDQVLANSFGSRLSEKTNLRVLPSNSLDPKFQKSYRMGGHTYYISHFPLNNTGLEVEVALDITSIKQDQRQQELHLTIVILFVLLGSIIAGSFLAQQIQKPLAKLIESATLYEHLDLSEPINIDTKLKEVVELSQVLENARIQIEEALTSLQKEKLWSDLLLTSIVEGIIILKNEDISYFSPGATRILGWEASEVAGKSINYVLIPSEQYLNFLSLIPPVGEKIRSNFTLKDGSNRLLSISRAELVQNSLEEPQTVLVLRDANQEEALSHLLGSFLGNITHEFRTPLTALSASIEILTEEISSLTPSETQELLNSIYLSTLNLENLIDNLLEGSNIETGRFHVSPQPSDLKMVINNACQTIEPLLKKYGQTLKINIPANLPMVQIDGRRINQVLLNMLSNASKYGPNDEVISLDVKEERKVIEVCIGDRGEGVPDVYRNKIFTGIVVEKNNSGRLQKGSGLGLSVSHAIIRAHGGQVGVRDRKGGGSEFWFTIPLTGEK